MTAKRLSEINLPLDTVVISYCTYYNFNEAVLIFWLYDDIIIENKNNEYVKKCKRMRLQNIFHPILACLSSLLFCIRYSLVCMGYEIDYSSIL